MRPLILDLTDWRPFGLDLGQWVRAHAVLVAAAVALGFLLLFWGQSRAARQGRRFDLLILAGSAVLVGALAMVAAAFGRVNAYGLMMALGFLTAIGLARWRARRCGESPDTITTLGILALVGGVLGSRGAYVIEHWDHFSGGSLGQMLAVTSGGLVFDGGLLLAMGLVVGYLLVWRLPVRRFLDIVAASAMVGLAFGRMGCLLNGCCYGEVCRQDFALGMRFPYAAPPLVHPHEGVSPYSEASHASPAYDDQYYGGQLADVPAALRAPDGRLRSPASLADRAALDAAMHAHSLAVHPAQVYGIANALILAVLLAAFFRLRTREGQVVALLFILYPITRIVLEAIRGDNQGMLLTPAQVKALVLAALGLAAMIGLRWLPASSGPVLAERLAARQTERPEPARPRHPGAGRRRL